MSKYFILFLLLAAIGGCKRTHYWASKPEYDGILSSSSSVTENWMPDRHDPKRPYEDHWVMNDAWAEFNENREKPVYAGIVELNGIALQFNAQNQDYSWQRGDRDTSLRTRWHWHVGGSDSVPPIDDSLTKPYGFRIVSPRSPRDTILKQKGFAIVYDDPGTDSVRIGIIYDSMRSHFLGKQYPYPGSGRFHGEIDTTAFNTGSCFIHGELLSHFPDSGIIQIGVQALDQSKVIEVGGKRYQIIAMSHARTFCFMKK